MENTVKLLDLRPAQFLAAVYTSKELTDKLNNCIYEAFSDFECREMLEPYLKGCSDWSIGIYNNNYIEISDKDDFLEAVGQHIRALATTDKVIKAYNKCQKLKQANSNLFGYTVENELRGAVLDEINQTAKYYEDLSYQVYCKEIANEQLNEWIDSEIIGCERYPFDTLILDLTTGEVRDERPKTTVSADQLKATQNRQKANTMKIDLTTLEKECVLTALATMAYDMKLPAEARNNYKRTYKVISDQLKEQTR